MNKSIEKDRKWPAHIVLAANAALAGTATYRRRTRAPNANIEIARRVHETRAFINGKPLIPSVLLNGFP